MPYKVAELSSRIVEKATPSKFLLRLKIDLFQPAELKFLNLESDLILA